MDQPISLCQVLEEEFAGLHSDSAHGLDPYRAPASAEEEQRRLEDLRARIHALHRKQSALCISGGGIRSATSGLGALQGLARNGLLAQFDYLSTVSGGGYVGGWLTAWMHHHTNAVLQHALDAAKKDVCAAEHAGAALDGWNLSAEAAHAALGKALRQSRAAAMLSLEKLSSLAIYHASRGLEIWPDPAADSSATAEIQPPFESACRWLLRLRERCREHPQAEPRVGQIRASAELCYYKLREIDDAVRGTPDTPASAGALDALGNHAECVEKWRAASDAALDAVNRLASQVRRASLRSGPDVVAVLRQPNAAEEVTREALHALIAQDLLCRRDGDDRDKFIEMHESRGFWARCWWKWRHVNFLGFHMHPAREVGVQSLSHPVRDAAYQISRRAVFSGLGTSAGHGDKLDPEAEPIRRLRQNSNYLDPRVGLLSADTWTLGATVIRNLLLNWIVLLPALAAILMIPRLHLSFSVLPYPPSPFASDNEWGMRLVTIMFACAAILYGASYFRLRLALPSTGGKPLTENQFVRGIFLGLLGFSWIASALWSWWRESDWLPAEFLYRANSLHPGAEVLILAILALLAFTFLGWLAFPCNRIREDVLSAFLSGRRIADFFAMLSVNAAQWILIVALAGKIKTFAEPYPYISAYACWATPTILLTFWLSLTLYLGIASMYTTDEDREWHARTGGWILMVLAVITGLNVIVIYGVPLLLKAKALALGVGGGSGIIAVWLGRQSASKPGTENSRPAWARVIYDFAPRLAAPVFVVLLLASLSFGTTWSLAKFTTIMEPSNTAHDQAQEQQPEFDPDNVRLKDFAFKGVTSAAHVKVLVGSDPRVLLGITAGLVGLSMLAGWLINMNKFSLHFMYRNRLIRAYLGASRSAAERSPDPFTGFDQDDNIAMHQLSRYQKPFHVLNLNLNLSASRNLAWQQRMGQSFTVSPLHVGSLALKTPCVPSPLYGAYRRAREYASLPSQHVDQHGITLGTAVAISGAAANPNMGYNSSTIVAFLMTLFNARLGAWLGNPAFQQGRLGRFVRFKPPWMLTAPRFSLFALLAEAFSLTGDTSPYVNLSDGGHFENLALYEMVLRRCHFIMVLDNGKDNCSADEYSFEDLGNAIRKIRVDLGVPIEIDFRPIRERKTHFVEGRIKYSAVDGEDVSDGVLVLAKPVLAENDEPADVFNYATANPDFPQQSTNDQWFNESQFESYRELGLHSTMKMPAEAWHAIIDGRVAPRGPGP